MDDTPASVAVPVAAAEPVVAWAEPKPAVADLTQQQKQAAWSKFFDARSLRVKEKEGRIPKNVYVAEMVKSGMRSDTPWKEWCLTFVNGNFRNLADNLNVTLLIAVGVIIASAFPIVSTFMTSALRYDVVKLDFTDCYAKNVSAPVSTTNPYRSISCTQLPILDPFSTGKYVISDAAQGTFIPTSLTVNGTCFVSTESSFEYLHSRRGVADLAIFAIFYVTVAIVLGSEIKEKFLLLFSLSMGEKVIKNETHFFIAQFHWFLAIAYLAMYSFISRRIEVASNVCGLYKVTYNKVFEGRVSVGLSLGLIMYQAGKSIADVYAKKYDWIDFDAFLTERPHRPYFAKIIPLITKETWTEEECTTAYWQWYETVLDRLNGEETGKDYTYKLEDWLEKPVSVGSKATVVPEVTKDSIPEGAKYAIAEA